MAKQPTKRCFFIWRASPYLWHYLKMCLKKCQLLIKPGRYRDIIRIHSRNKSPGCKRQTAVKRRRKPTVLFIADQPNPHIFFTILRQPLVKRLLRSVLTNNQFKIRKRLPQDGINRTCSLYVLFINTSPLKRIVPAYGISCHFAQEIFHLHPAPIFAILLPFL